MFESTKLKCAIASAFHWILFKNEIYTNKWTIFQFIYRKEETISLIKIVEALIDEYLKKIKTIIDQLNIFTQKEFVCLHSLYSTKRIWKTKNWINNRNVNSNSFPWCNLLHLKNWTNCNYIKEKNFCIAFRVTSQLVIAHISNIFLKWKVTKQKSENDENILGIFHFIDVRLPGKFHHK